MTTTKTQTKYVPIHNWTDCKVCQTHLPWSLHHAAPELLEAAKEAILKAEFRHCPEVAKKLNQAILKAEGKE